MNVLADHYPVVGDWVQLTMIPEENKGVIHKVLPRKTIVSRQAAGTKTEQQVVATNIDYIFLLMGLHLDFNIRRLERYLVTAYDSGAQPIIVLTKKDLCMNVDERVYEVNNIAYGVPIIPLSNVTREGIEHLQPYLQEGKTAAFIGSSGVGKSSLLNSLLKSSAQKTIDVREGDDRGRHTTTHKELFLLPTGAMVIDTPGMRELQLWDAAEGLGSTFYDIEELAQQCRFKDCTHETEPDCAVQAGLAAGTMSQQRLDSYRKLQRELLFAQRKQDTSLAWAEKQKTKHISKWQKQYYKKR
ncbi:ribosome small subunit-dependent GTPase A [Aneurinibacillus sp. REN35]|uniref:ribosome small subunit-dependent GTPase A n=1 Tax=Aneurinibacillus sp. REN35 TaxID=3237286 RepID=UPI00352992C0